jgi:hypothetical protein
MPDSIRSATVRLEAQVASYIADMERAGKATDDAFRRSSVSAKQLDKDVAGVSTRTQELGKRTSSLEGDFSRARGEADKLATSVQRVGTASERTSTAQTRLSQDVERTDRSMRNGSRGLDSYTDRLGLLISSIGAFGPALGPVGALGVGALTGLANDAGAAAMAGGSLILAFQGVGKALQAVNKAAIDPTTANLQAAKLQMEQLSPAARDFVNQLHDMMPLLQRIQGSAAAGWFPGLTKALHELVPLAPVIGRIFHDVGRMGGELAAKGAASLASDKWRPFFEFIDQQAPKAMAALGHVVASLAHGLAELWMAFTPVNTSFNRWLVDAARSFDQWASGLSKTQGFHDFVAYLQENGPKVAQAAAAIGHALLQIVQAAAPLGGPTLEALTAIAKAIGAIADSPLGTPILAIVQLASAMRLLKAAMGGIGSARGGVADLALIGPQLDRALPSFSRFKAGLTNMRAGLKEVNSLGGGPLNLFNSAARTSSAEAERFGKGLRSMAAEGLKAAAPIAAVAVASSGVADKFGLSNTATLAMAGAMAGPWGAAAGATVGLLIDLSSRQDDLTTSVNAFNAAAQNGAGAAALRDTYSNVQAQFATFQNSDAAKVFGADTVARLGHAVDAMGSTVTAAENAENAQLGLSQSFVRTAHAAGMTGSQLAALTAQTNAATSATLSAFSAETSYREALVAARKQAATNSAGFKGDSAAALKNREALQNLASSWAQNLQAMQSNGASMDAMDRRFTTARAAFVKVAESMGVSKKAAEEYANSLLAIPASRQTILGVIDHASGGIRGVLAELNQLHDRTVNVWTKMYTIHVPSASNNAKGSHGFHIDPSTGQAVPNSADGGTIPHDGRAYGDRYLYMLAPGEEVISNRHGQADRHRGLLKAINADRHAADGTTVPGGVSTYSRTSLRTNVQDPGWGNLRDHLKATTKELDREKAARTALVDKMHQLSTSVQDNLRTDLFGTSNPWTSMYGGTSPAGVMGTLRGDNADIRSEIAAINTLKAKGLTGDALAAVLAQGGLEGAKAFAALPAKDLAAYERLFNQRARLLHSVGSLAGSAAYGGRISEEAKEIRILNGKVDKLTKQLHDAEHQRHKDSKDHTSAQQRGASSTRRRATRRPNP